MKYFDGVGHFTATTGTGTVTLGGTLGTNFFSFLEQGAEDGDKPYYRLDDAGDVEIGKGTLGNSVTELSRDNVLRSRISGVAGTTKLTLSGAAQVRCIAPADALALMVSADFAQEFSAAREEQARANIGLAMIGMVADFAGLTAPAGWLFCYGQNVSRTTYAALFAIVGTQHGPGDGSTTFGIPDLRGRVVAGQDDMGGSSANRLTGLSGGVNGDTFGAAGGAESHTLTESQMPAHNHSINRGDNTGTGGGARVVKGDGSNADTAITGTTGSGAAHNNVQPTLILNKIIFAGV